MLKKFIFLTFIYFLHSSTVFKCYANHQEGFEMLYFEDVDNICTFESVKTELFQVSKKKSVLLGYTKSTAWVKLILNTNFLSSNAILEIRSPLLDEITLAYVTKNNGVVKETLGIMFPHTKNKLNHFKPAFKIPIDQLQSNEVYLKVKSRWSMSIYPTIKNKDVFFNERVDAYFIISLLLGGLIFMAIYNLFLFFSLRDFNYLYYLLALLSNIITQGYLLGLFIQYISPECTEFSFSIPLYAMATTRIFSVLFTLKFLSITKKDGVLYYLLITFIVTSLITMSLETLDFNFLSRNITLVENILIAVIIYIASIYSIIKKNKLALYFNIAWTPYLTGIILYALNKKGIIPSTFFTEYFAHIGTFIEVMVLSFALAYKYRLVIKEKEKLEQQTREELEELVHVQTAELEATLAEKEILLKEIHHRVKNNLQIIISLLDLQVASVKNIKDKNVLMQSKSRVYSMSLIHQKLYQSNNLACINLKDYLNDLLTYVKNSYANESTNIEYHIAIEDKELSLTQAVPLGLIVNELLTNSLKHSIKETEKNYIKLTLAIDEKNLVLIMGDSGSGFENNYDIKKSLGLFLIKSLNNQLRGEITRYFEENLFVTKLIFPIKD